MKKTILYRTNILVCIIILLGFVITSVISYSSNQKAFEQDIEKVSELTSQGIYHEIDTIFSKPIYISTTMANDNLLREFLEDEKKHLEDNTFIERMREYLLNYKEKYSYDSVFLVSAQTNQYYHFNGLDRVLTKDNKENVWYYSFLQSDKEYSLNIDNDEALNNEITVFINCKIRDKSGTIMGVVGVGFQVNILQSLLKEYETNFDVHAFLIDETGEIEISTDQSSYETVNLFDHSEYFHLKDQIKLDKQEKQTFWYSSNGKKEFIISRYIPTLEWYLLIDNDMSKIHENLSHQLFRSILVVIIVILGVMFIITRIIQKYNAQIVNLTISKERKHRMIFRKATEQLYENIYEVDITHNCAASEATQKYFESLGVPKDMSYDEALHMIMDKQIKEEFRQGYLDTFSTTHVLKSYQNGEDTLHYEFMISLDGNDYYWMRITARIFYWGDDHSIRMFVYQQNIDLEKRQEKQMMEQIQKDSLSGLYNKAATQRYIQMELLDNSDKLFAFFILDIDNFKRVNDTYGHAVGDTVISQFAEVLRGQFSQEDIIGRIGGDEFVAFLSVSSIEWVNQKAEELVVAIHSNKIAELEISASIGISIAPSAGKDFETLYKNADCALYQTKQKEKDGFTIYSDLFFSYDK